MLVLLLVALASLFFLHGPSGKPFLTWGDFKPDEKLTGQISELLEDTQSESQNQPTEVYKWQDKDGVWQFSNRAEDAVGAETIELNGAINTMAPLAASAEKSPVTTKQTPALPIPSLTTAPIDQALDTINQAKQLQQTIDKRKSDLDEAIRGNQ